MPADDLVISDLDPEVLDKVEEVARTAAYAVIQHESHAGPMPSPRDFALYDKVLPGTAQTIRDEFVKNADHVRAMQGTGMQYQKDDNDRNRKSAERLMWGALVASFILALAGKEVVAGILATSSVGAIVAGFLKAKREKKERNKRVEPSSADGDTSSADDQH